MIRSGQSYLKANGIEARPRAIGTVNTNTITPKLGSKFNLRLG